jgi:hypothetical protein
MTEHAGPVLDGGAVARAVVAAICNENPGTTIQDRGSYVRVLCEGRCRVTREAIERVLGRPFQLPGDLEVIMPSFRGRFEVTEDAAAWTGRGPK